jgi:prevent-host-death family protein
VKRRAGDAYKIHHGDTTSSSTPCGVLREVSEETAITITRHGEPAAVLMSPAVHEGIQGMESYPAWPAGYFEETYGALAEDPLERPPQG